MAEYYRQMPEQPRPDDIEQEFGHAMHSVYTRAKSEAGYNATYFLHMLDDVGPIEAARRLVMSTKPSQGFTALWERRRLDLTVEANVVKAQFAPLFTEDERDAARSRLAAYGYVPAPE